MVAFIAHRPPTPEPSASSTSPAMMRALRAVLVLVLHAVVAATGPNHASAQDALRNLVRSPSC